MVTKEQQKAKAIECMKQLDIYKPYIEGFEKENQVCFYERFGGYWVYQEPELEAKMKAIENKFGATVYAITHEMMFFGECYSFLLVPKYKEDWEYLLTKAEQGFYATAYVWNKSDEYCSEFGDISVVSFGGGIKRIG